MLRLSTMFRDDNVAPLFELLISLMSEEKKKKKKRYNLRKVTIYNRQCLDCSVTLVRDLRADFNPRVSRSDRSIRYSKINRTSLQTYTITLVTNLSLRDRRDPTSLSIGGSSPFAYSISIFTSVERVAYCSRICTTPGFLFQLVYEAGGFHRGSFSSNARRLVPIEGSGRVIIKRSDESCLRSKLETDKVSLSVIETERN